MLEPSAWPRACSSKQSYAPSAWRGASGVTPPGVACAAPRLRVNSTGLTLTTGTTTHSAPLGRHGSRGLLLLHNMGRNEAMRLCVVQAGDASPRRSTRVRLSTRARRRPRAVPPRAALVLSSGDGNVLVVCVCACARACCSCVYVCLRCVRWRCRCPASARVPVGGRCSSRTCRSRTINVGSAVVVAFGVWYARCALWDDQLHVGVADVWASECSVRARRIEMPPGATVCHLLLDAATTAGPAL